MAVQPLSPATDRRLGGPLPRQLSNQTQAHLCAVNLWYKDHAIPIRYAVLAAVSGCYPAHRGRLLTRYSPVRHCSVPEGTSPFDLNVLCTPPAFILSQDQTLECWYQKNLTAHSIVFIRAIDLALVTSIYSLFKGIVEILSSSFLH